MKELNEIKKVMEDWYNTSLESIALKEGRRNFEEEWTNCVKSFLTPELSDWISKGYQLEFFEREVISIRSLYYECILSTTVIPKLNYSDLKNEFKLRETGMYEVEDLFTSELKLKNTRIGVDLPLTLSTTTNENYSFLKKLYKDNPEIEKRLIDARNNLITIQDEALISLKNVLL